MQIKALIFFLLTVCLGFADPLPSWNEGAAKTAILQFVKEAIETVPLQERIAVFDQDGTLWVEQPVYTQLMFAIDRIKILAKEHPEWNEQEPYKAILTGNHEAMKNFKEHDIAKIIAVTHVGMSIEDFQYIVKKWLKTALHPRFKRPYTELVYQPMLEVLQFLSSQGFTNYIVSGGGQEFMRAYAKEVYQIPPERVIGTAGKVEFKYQNGEPILEKLPDLLYIDDKTGKPEAINLIIGRRPIAAFGNSEGDKQMLEWTQAGIQKHFELLVHHGDTEREYAYGEHSAIGSFPESLLDKAKQSRWVVVSMKNDWKVIFPWQIKVR